MLHGQNNVVHVELSHVERSATLKSFCFGVSGKVIGRDDYPLISRRGGWDGAQKSPCRSVGKVFSVFVQVAINQLGVQAVFSVTDIRGRCECSVSLSQEASASSSSARFWKLYAHNQGEPQSAHHDRPVVCRGEDTQGQLKGRLCHLDQSCVCKGCCSVNKTTLGRVRRAWASV